jgi:hypothetical protein
MRSRDRIHPALKHGAYAATAVLPGESRAAFEKLHRDIISELGPSGALEDDIVMTIARLLWRKQNLETLHIAEHARSRCAAIRRSDEIFSAALFCIPMPVEEPNPAKREEDRRIAEEKKRAEEAQIQDELGDTYELVKLGKAATFDGLAKELDLKDRLDASIEKCFKRLLLVRGLKSISAAPTLTSPKRILGPSKAA